MKTLLWIDDDEKLIDASSSVFLEHGFIILKATNTTRALSILRDYKLDGVLLDVRLRGNEDGLELLKEVLYLYPTLKVVIFTAYPEYDDHIHAEELGALAYLPKIKKSLPLDKEKQRRFFQALDRIFEVKSSPAGLTQLAIEQAQLVALNTTGKTISTNTKDILKDPNQNAEYVERMLRIERGINAMRSEEAHPTGLIPRAVVFTALPVEYEAVCAHLSKLSEITHPQGTIYETGKFVAAVSTWEVTIVEIGQGNTTAAMEAERALQIFNPAVALFVGVAGGVKDVRLGDVVAATKVYEYHSGKDKETFRPRPNVWSSTYRMEQRARIESKKDNWLERIKGLQSNVTPKAFVGPIAAGAVVVASTQSATYEFLQTHYSDTLAVEMEGYGFLEAVHANPGVEALIIRGISDLIDSKNEADAGGSQQVAARNASAFAFEILANIVLPSNAQTSIQQDLPG